jgi:predicted TPR repeat methyltransferase
MNSSIVLALSFLMLLSVMQSVPPDAAELYREANKLLEAGDVETALDKYRASLTLDASSPLVWSNLATALKTKGAMREALDAYRQAVYLDNTRARSHYNLGVCLYSMEILKEAATSFRTAVDLDSSYLNAHFNLGVVLQDLGEQVPAAHAYAEAIRIDPYHAGARVNYCNILATCNDRVRSEQCYRDLLRLHPDHLPGLISLAGLLHRETSTSDHDQAKELYARVLYLDSSNSMARHGLAALGGSDVNAVVVEEDYIRDLFDGYSANFEASLRTLAYKAPDIILAGILSVDSARVDAGFKYDALDLGAGTGLACTALRPYVRSITGVDLSPKMLTKARALACYDSTYVGEIVGFVRERSEANTYDLVVAADVLMYLPRLDELISGNHRLLKEDGLFAFTIEADVTEETRCDGLEAVAECRQSSAGRLLVTGRYAHTAAYVEQAAASAGLRIALRQPCVSRYDRGSPINGLLFILRKSKE